MAARKSLKNVMRKLQQTNNKKEQLLKLLFLLKKIRNLSIRADKRLVKLMYIERTRKNAVRT